MLLLLDEWFIHSKLDIALDIHLGYTEALFSGPERNETGLYALLVLLYLDESNRRQLCASTVLQHVRQGQEKDNTLALKKERGGARPFKFKGVVTVSWEQIG